MNAMLRTIAILNQKGGVGKTTVTLGLASAAAAAGRRVLVVDLDPQAASTWVLGHDPTAVTSVANLLDSEPSKAAVRDTIVASAWTSDGDGADDTGSAERRSGGRIDVLPGSSRLQEFERGSMKRLRTALDRLPHAYDAILVDCPPSLGTLTRSALTASRHALVVVEPSALGLRGIGGVADAIDEVWDSTNPDLELTGIVLNRVPAISTEAERRVDELARIVGRSAIWKPAIPQRVVLNQAIGERRSVHSYGHRAAAPIEAFDRLWVRLRTAIRNGER